MNIDPVTGLIVLNKTINNSLIGSECIGWCQESVNLIHQNINNEYITLIAISYLLIIISDILNDHKEKIKYKKIIKYTKIIESIKLLGFVIGILTIIELILF